MTLQLNRELLLPVLATILMLHQVGPSRLVGQGTAPDAVLDAPRPLRAVDARLDDALKQISETFHISMVVELASPVPIAKMPSATMTAREALNAITKRYPQYNWGQQDSVVHFYDQSVKAERENSLNLQLESFTISGTIADVELRLKSEINKARHGIKSQGGLVVGIRPTELDKQRLPTIVLKNVRARDVLFKLGGVSPRFYTVIVFPRSHGLTSADMDEAFASWRWFAIESGSHD